jgi:hypothetical protein
MMHSQTFDKSPVRTATCRTLTGLVRLDGKLPIVPMTQNCQVPRLVRTLNHNDEDNGDVGALSATGTIMLATLFALAGGYKSSPVVVR